MSHYYRNPQGTQVMYRRHDAVQIDDATACTTVQSTDQPTLLDCVKGMLEISEKEYWLRFRGLKDGARVERRGMEVSGRE